MARTNLSGYCFRGFSIGPGFDVVRETSGLHLSWGLWAFTCGDLDVTNQYVSVIRENTRPGMGRGVGITTVNSY